MSRNSINFSTFDNHYKVSFVTEKESYSTEDTVIKYSVTNISDDEICIAGDDNCFELHKLVDGEWKRVVTKTEHNWNEIGLVLMPNQTEKREINLTDFYDLPLEKGEYRICMEYFASNTFEIS